MMSSGQELERKRTGTNNENEEDYKSKLIYSG